jgi:hypothetical protein
MFLIPVVVKKSKLKNSFPYWGGLLNPDARYYVRKVTSKNNPQQQLETIKRSL